MMRMRAGIILISLATMLVVSGCNATVKGARNVTATSARLVAVGHSSCGTGGTYHFEYATSLVNLTTNNVGTKTPTRTFDETPGACTTAADLPFFEDVTGLTPETTYYYRVCGRDEGAAADDCSSATSSFSTSEAWTDAAMQPIVADGKLLKAGGEEFRVYGFNDPHIDYLHDPSPANYLRMTRMLDNAVGLGANTMRIHLQLFDLIDAPASSPGDLRINEANREAYKTLVAEAEQRHLYLDVIGNNVWFPAQAPAWYDEMTHEDRWDVQEFYFRELAGSVAGSPAVLCYELTNEPTISTLAGATWYGSSFTEDPASPHYVQVMARGIASGNRPAVATAWMTQLRDAIWAVDPGRLVTIGSLQSSGTSTYFNPTVQAAVLPLLSVHIYPKPTAVVEDDGKTPEQRAQEGIDAAVASAQLWGATDKPVFLGETSPWQGPSLFTPFMTAANEHVNGFVGFYHGLNPTDMPASTLHEKIGVLYLEQFLEHHDLVKGGT